MSNYLKLWLVVSLIFTTSIVTFSQTENSSSSKLNIYVAAFGSYTSSLDFDFGDFYTTSSFGAEIGYLFLKNSSVGLCYEKGKINEYEARSKNMTFYQMNIKQLIPVNSKLFISTSLSGGIGKGVDKNYGLNPQLDPEFSVKSKFVFFEIGGRFIIRHGLYTELRFLQYGYINKQIDKMYPSTSRGYILNDEEQYPLRLSIGYQF